MSDEAKILPFAVPSGSSGQLTVEHTQAIRRGMEPKVTIVVHTSVVLSDAVLALAAEYPNQEIVASEYVKPDQAIVMRSDGGDRIFRMLL